MVWDGFEETQILRGVSSFRRRKERQDIMQAHDPTLAMTTNYELRWHRRGVRRSVSLTRRWNNRIASRLSRSIYNRFVFTTFYAKKASERQVLPVRLKFSISYCTTANINILLF